MKTSNRRRQLVMGSILASALLGTTVHAATYPDRPIRLVVGFAAGGFTDVLARLIAQKLSVQLGQPVIVDNKAGATGTIGADQVSKSAPDGYTLLLAHSGSNSVAPALYPKLPYDVIKGFTPIIRVASTPMVLTVNPVVPVQDVKGFIAHARKAPNTLSFASSGKGTSQHLAAEMFMQSTGVQMVHVPYRGSGAAITDLLSGVVQLNFESPPNVLPHIKAGKLKPLAITSLQRSPLLPDVPTFDEAGLSKFEMSQWFAVMGPPNMPKPLTQKLNKDIGDILKMPDIVEKIASQGGQIQGGSPEEFAAFLGGDTAKWAKLIKDANIQLD